MNFAAILNASITASMLLTASFVILGLAYVIVQCWIDSAPKTLEHLETVSIIQEVSKTVLEAQKVTFQGETSNTSFEPSEAVLEESSPDFWTLPLNSTERAIATVKSQSTDPEILMIAAPKKLSKAEINKAKKTQLEAMCQFWNVTTGTVTSMKNELKRVAC